MAGPIIRLDAVKILTGLSKSAIYDRMDKNSPRYAKDFPKCFGLDGGAVGWFLSDFEKWQQALAAKGRNGSPSKKSPSARRADSVARQGASPTGSTEAQKPAKKADAPGNRSFKPANAHVKPQQGSKPRSLADAIVQGSLINDRLRYFLELTTWTPAMGALLISGIDAPQDCTAIPDQGVGLDGKSLHPSDSRFSEARRILRDWHEWQEDAGDHSTEIVPVGFLNWCLREEISTEWLGLCLDLIGFTDPSKIDLTSSRFALLTRN
ncbi:AlpA family phage regulatory protein [Polaromonas sp. YR568]|uniref:AlpA family phage regulatory protein n=1 Tax=Polaromonas sp. YR568 TaxID=1855301 RepID=UPI0031381A16